MFLIHCHVLVKPDRVSDFVEVSTTNARASLQEPGCRRFDVVQQLDDDTRFVLVEEYDSAEDLEFHKTQQHYLDWRAAMEDIQVERDATKYRMVSA